VQTCKRHCLAKNILYLEHPEEDLHKRTKTRLLKLGLRNTSEERILSSGITSYTFWDIEKIGDYPLFVLTKAIEEFAWDVGGKKPKSLVGIPKGGLLIAQALSNILHTPVHNQYHLDLPHPLVLVDDVLTTGNTIKTILEEMYTKPDFIAILINRSTLSHLNGIPIIYGVQTDIVYPPKERTK